MSAEGAILEESDKDLNDNSAQDSETEFLDNPLPAVGKEAELAHSEFTPRDRMQNQIRLAFELAKEVSGKEDFKLDTEEQRNELMLKYWLSREDGGENYSVIYKRMENDPALKTHPRIFGNIYKITGADVLYYEKHGELPKE
jgi:hypothetical protein